MKRWAAVILVCVFAALGTGLAEFWHNQVHEMEDALEAAEARAAGLPVSEHPVHDESNCAMHAQLHLPLLSASYVPLLVLVGVFVAFLTLLSMGVDSYRVPVRIDCRGPPVVVP